MRIVLDTNILISGFIFSKQSKIYLDLLFNNRSTFLYSDFTYSEIKNTLKKKNFLKYITGEKIKDIEIFFNTNEKIEILKNFDVSKHKDDNHFIDVAVNGNADYILSGDNHLLSIKEFKGIKIVTIKEFVENFSA